MTSDQQPEQEPTTAAPLEQPTSREELEWVWCLAQPSYSEETWRALWRTYGDRRLRPREPITAYRAAFPGGERGISWAPDRADAEHYVTPAKGGQARRIYRTTLQPSAVVGVVSSTGEIVVDPRRLGRVVDVTDSTEGTTRGRQGRAEQRAAEADQQRRAAERARERGTARRQAEQDVLDRWAGRARARRASRGQQQDRTARPSPRERTEHLAVQRDTQALLARSQTYLAQLEQDRAPIEEDEALVQSQAFLAQLEQDRAATRAELEALAASDPEDVIRQAILARQQARQAEQQEAS